MKEESGHEKIGGTAASIIFIFRSILIQCNYLQTFRIKQPMKFTLRLHLLVCLGLLPLSGCYTPQQDLYKTEMTPSASNGMSTQALVSSIVNKGFACSRSSDSHPKHDCSRTKQNVFPPYSCVERMRFVDFAGVATNVDISLVACAGF